MGTKPEIVNFIDRCVLHCNIEKEEHLFWSASSWYLIDVEVAVRRDSDRRGKKFACQAGIHFHLRSCFKPVKSTAFKRA